MELTEIFLIGVALSMDAFSVCLGAGMMYTGLTRRQMLSMPTAFGIAQGIMPAAGYFLGYLFANIISKFQGPLSLIILSIIGINMIREGFSPEARESGGKQLTFASLIMLAFATSIDAFAVGVSFAASGISVSLENPKNNIFFAALLIAATTFVLCLIALPLGKKVGEKLGEKAEILGGVILIIIGIKNMFF